MKTYSLFFLFLGLTACSKKPFHTNEYFDGVLLKKPWSKSTQSYCAGGSDYYVLKTESEEWVLDTTQFETDWQKWVNDSVSVFGKVEKRIKKPQEGGISQHPVNAFDEDNTFECSVLVVVNLAKP